MATPSPGYTLIQFRPRPHGRYLGGAIWRMPSGCIARTSVYREHGIYFGPVAASPDLFSAAALGHECSRGCARRCAAAGRSCSSRPSHDQAQR
jgi:hypothetical protein